MKITIVGLGIDPRKDLTLAAISAMKNSTKTYVLAPEESLLTLRELGIESQSIYHLYGDGHADMNNYERICRFIAGEARAFENVTLAVPGHPSVGVTAVELLRKRNWSQEAGIDPKVSNIQELEVEVLPGISSLDWMLTEQKRDLIEHGSLILDANRILLFDLNLVPETDLYIYHVCSVGTRYAFVSNPSRENHLADLKNKLLKHYDEKQECYLLSSLAESNHRDEYPGVVCICELGSLEELLPFVSFASTLFIPANSPTRVDSEFLSLLQS